MAYEQHDNSGSLFRNDRAETDRHPTHTGSAKIDGKEYWVSAWVKESASGKKYFSMAYKQKEEQAAKVERSALAEEGQLDDDVPF